MTVSDAKWEPKQECALRQIALLSFMQHCGEVCSAPCSVRAKQGGSTACCRERCQARQLQVLMILFTI
jgi:hypothetical protein